VLTITLNVLLQAAAVAAGAQDYATAYRQTTESGKPLVVLVGADWCPGCRQMKYTAIPEVERGGGLQKVAFAYVNTDQEGELAGKLMQGGSIPQLVMYQKTPTGWKRQQLTGAHSPGAIQQFIDQATQMPVAELDHQQR
jgi:thioredoxin-like negative regulator of GroEL